MASFFYGYSEPQCISGPRFTTGRGPQWDQAEAVYLCQGDMLNLGGFRRNDPFPGTPGFIIDGDPEPESIGRNAYTVRLSGRGVRSPRVYSMPISYGASEQRTDITIGGIPYSQFDPAWPEVDLLLNSSGFRQTIVGATQINGSPGDKVGAPQVGSFPAPPANPWESVKVPRLQVPWGWVILRHEAEPLLDGAYSTTGPFILITEYVWRHRIVPGG